ncbi:unnamed protein product, partial [Musa banksii]
LLPFFLHAHFLRLHCSRGEKKDGALGIRRKQGSKACAESKKRGLERPYQFFVHEKDMATERLVKLSSTTRFNVASNAPSH